VLIINFWALGIKKFWDLGNLKYLRVNYLLLYMPITAYLPGYEETLVEGSIHRLVSYQGQPAIDLGNGRCILMNGKDAFGNTYEVGQKVSVSFESHPKSFNGLLTRTLGFLRIQ
jgi:hypothetical protein